MTVIGIDLGAKNTKVVILRSKEILATSSVLSGFDQQSSAEEAVNEALNNAKIARDEVKHITATGAGMDAITFANNTVTEISASARGILKVFPSVRTVIDVGAEEGKAIRLDENGKVFLSINKKQ